MKKTSKTVVFFGNERLATGAKTNAPTLSALVSAGYHVAAVVSNYERGTSRTARDLEVAQVAQRHKIPLLLPRKPADINNQLAAYKPDIGILVAYGKIVPESTMNLFPHGIINIHPSLLPRHRGPTPIENAILQGETETGVSIMKLVKAMDAGPVYGQSEIELTDTESKQELADRLLEIGGTMLIELLPDILSGSVVALPQDNSYATYDNLLSKDQGLLDWKKPAKQLEREIRAYMEWPKSRASITDKDVIITKASVLPLSGQIGEVSFMDKQIIVFCAEGALKIERLKPIGKKEMSAAEFLTGYGHISKKRS